MPLSRERLAHPPHTSKEEASAAQRRANNREYANAIARRSHAKHREERNPKARAYYHTHKKERTVYRKIYSKEHPEKFRTYAKRRYALKRGASKHENVSLDVIFERDKGICSLCLKRVKRAEASMDHVIPLMQGGDHTYQNCALAHIRCNCSKRASTITQQQRLF